MCFIVLGTITWSLELSINQSSVSTPLHNDPQVAAHLVANPPQSRSTVCFCISDIKSKALSN